MGCPAGYHVGRASSLLGGVNSNQTPETCLRDSNYDAFDPLTILQSVANVVLPVLNVPGIVEPAATRLPDVFESSLGFSESEKQYIDLGVQAVTTVLSSGADTMGFFDDFGLDAVVDWASDIFDDVSLGEVAGFGLDVAQTFLPQNTQAVAIPVMSKVPQIAGAAGSAAAGAIARVGPTVGRRFFNKFPNLATAIQKMRNAGHNVSRSKLYSMVKRFGPEFMVTAGIMSAAAVSELLIAGPGHRRMNPANAKALRRATRRIKSFHKLCGDADVIKTRRRSCAKKC